MADVLRDEGIALFTGVSAQRVRAIIDGVEIDLSDGRTLSAERILVATGRRANPFGLGLENVGLNPVARSIEVDGHMRAGDGLWAVGDITGKGQFTHVAVHQGRIAAADILGQEHATADYRAVPRVTFLDPEVASVGLTAERACEEEVNVQVGLTETKVTARGWIHGPGAQQGHQAGCGRRPQDRCRWFGQRRLRPVRLWVSWHWPSRSRYRSGTCANSSILIRPSFEGSRMRSGSWIPDVAITEVARASLWMMSPNDPSHRS